MATYHTTDELRHESNDHTVLYFIVGLLFAAAVIFGVYYYTVDRPASQLPAGATTVEQVQTPVLERTATEPTDTAPVNGNMTMQQQPAPNNAVR